MGALKLPLLLIFLLWLLPGSLAALSEDDVGQVSDLPQCAAQCWARATPASCGSVDNATCICTSNSFDRSLIDCLNNNCLLLPSYKALRLSQLTCDRPVRDRKEIIWVLLPLHIFAMLCVITRLYAKAFVFRRFWTDDWIILVASLLYFGWFCVQHHLFQMAFGGDIWWSDPDELTTAMLLLYLSQPIYLWLLGLTKASLICFYLRLFPHQNFRKLCYCALGLVVSETITWTFLTILECTPIPYNWMGWMGTMQGTCLDRQVIMITISAVNLVIDTFIIAMPIPLVLKMRSTPRRKFAIIIMFSLGILVIAASAVRLRYVVEYGKSKNFTYDYVDMLIWTGIEIAASIVVTSLPCIRLLLHRRFPGLLTRIFAFGAHATGDREYLGKYPTAPKVKKAAVHFSDRLGRFHRREPSIPSTIGGDVQDDISPKMKLEARKARHMAALRRGAGEASRALASILGTMTQTMQRSVSMSALASGDRDTENRMGMGMAPRLFAKQLNEELEEINSSTVTLEQEKPSR